MEWAVEVSVEWEDTLLINFMMWIRYQEVNKKNTYTIQAVTTDFGLLSDNDFAIDHLATIHLLL
jgi:hypothetical protein